MVRTTEITRRRRRETHIEDLHEEILSRITGQLNLKESVQTSVLSKKWRHIWSSQRKLTLDCPSVLGIHNVVDDKGMAVFARRADAIMRQRRVAVTDLQIRCVMASMHAAEIDRWLGTAAAAARHLTLDFHWEGQRCAILPCIYVFPFRLLTAGSGGGRYLESLHLLHVSMKALATCSSPPCLPRLKRLELAFSDADEVAVHLLLAACAGTLEWLRFEECQVLRGLAIGDDDYPPLARLRRFAVDDCCRLRWIEVRRAPALAAFRLVGRFHETRVLIDAAQLAAMEELDVTYKCCIEHDIFECVRTGLPSRTPRLTKLSVSTSGSFNPVAFPQKWMHLRHLRLSVPAGDETSSKREERDVLQLALFLEAAPFLELFHLNMWSTERTQYDDENMEKLRSLSPCRPHEHLKTVHMSGFTGLKDQIELARHILRNAVSLERMTINVEFADGEPQRFYREPASAIAVQQGRWFARTCLRSSDTRKVLDIL
uniref:FBD domain-containing protein n=1 Tax=Oryza punctata TaxID=4537 RepID=A0A0E0LHG2_ORYPU